MNKQDALKRIEIIEREAAMLRKIVETPEKPKLRLGDFGITTRESVDELDKFVVIETPKGELEPLYQNGQTDGCCYAKKHPKDYIILGNVFDLLKEWSEDLVEFSVDGKLSKLDFTDKACPFLIFNYWFTSPQAEEFYHNLGKMLATFKRKENKNV